VSRSLTDSQRRDWLKLARRASHRLTNFCNASGRRRRRWPACPSRGRRRIGAAAHEGSLPTGMVAMLGAAKLMLGGMVAAA